MASPMPQHESSHITIMNFFPSSLQYFHRKRRRALNQALNKIKSGERFKEKEEDWLLSYYQTHSVNPYLKPTFCRVDAVGFHFFVANHD